MIYVPPPPSTERPTYVVVVEFDHGDWTTEIPELHVTTRSPTVVAAAADVRQAIAEATYTDEHAFDVRTIVSYSGHTIS